MGRRAVSLSLCAISNVPPFFFVFFSFFATFLSSSPLPHLLLPRSPPPRPRPPPRRRGRSSARDRQGRCFLPSASPPPLAWRVEGAWAACSPHPAPALNVCSILYLTLNFTCSSNPMYARSRIIPYIYRSGRRLYHTKSAADVLRNADGWCTWAWRKTRLVPATGQSAAICRRTLQCREVG